MKRYALIPAYQPDETLVGFTRALEHEGFEVLLVDDGSGAAYRTLFDASSACCVLRHEENRGKGAALKTGLAWLRDHAQGPYVVVTADADGQHLPSDILEVADEAQLHPDSLILGTRSFQGQVPLRSRLGNGFSRLLLRLCAGAWVQDTQTGLRGFREGLVDWLLSVNGERYEYEMNVLLSAARQQMSLRSVPIQTVYQPGNPTSHFRALRDSGRILGQALRFSAASLTSFGVDFGLFCIFSRLTGLIAASNVAARLFSAALNFTLNRHLVFGVQGSAAVQARRYALLAVTLLLSSTFLVKALTLGGLYPPAAKLVTELGLFLCSYTIQRRFIFQPQEQRRALPKKEELL